MIGPIGNTPVLLNVSTFMHIDVFEYVHTLEHVLEREISDGARLVSRALEAASCVVVVDATVSMRSIYPSGSRRQSRNQDAAFFFSEYARAIYSYTPPDATPCAI